jgi:hypothetical protein
VVDVSDDRDVPNLFLHAEPPTASR